MSRPLSPAQYAELFKKSRSTPWVWLLEVRVDVGGGSVESLRLARNPVSLQWRTFDDGETPIEWVPFWFEIGGMEENNEGSLRDLSLSASNVTREIQALFEHYQGLEGSSLTLYLVDASRLDDENPILEVDGEVVSSAANPQTATIQVGQMSLQSVHFPAQRVSRTSCRHFEAGEYGGDLCGYDTTRSGSLQVCDGTYDGPLGCVMHGDDEDAAGEPRLHPLRGGFARGVARKTGLGAT